MRIQFVTVGKLKEKYWKQACEEYRKRLGSYIKLDELELAEEKASEPVHPSETKMILQKEGARILQAIPTDAYCIVLAVKGKNLTSEDLAKHLEELALRGRSKISFVIGGSYGLSPEVYQRADFSLSFSSFTFPHQMMKVILYEQVYRACKIQRGEAYHK